MWGKRPAAMLAINTGKGGTPEGESKGMYITMLPPSANKAAHSGFETQRRHHLKSKTGVSVAPKWTCVQQKFKKYILQSSCIVCGQSV